MIFINKTELNKKDNYKQLDKQCEVNVPIIIET